MSGSNRAGALLRPRRQRRQDTECGPNRPSQGVLLGTRSEERSEGTQHEKCWRAVESGTGVQSPDEPGQVK